MATLSNILDYSSGKTRVLIYSTHSSISKLVLQTLADAGRNVDFFLADGTFKKEENDFVILETADVYKAAQFEPTIMFASNEMSVEDILSVSRNITPGGALIFPLTMENDLDDSANFFRKLPFSAATVENKNGRFFLSTEMGPVPLATKEEILFQNFDGIQILLQQFGVLAGDFFEVLLTFE
ncbi:hypothetical protein [Kaistella palustris]|uniref:hypothetical protein n=1 Tax=Kaistella palustris TaxID=493376 RepID=UPI0003F61FF3|nr:hypothetical protein [Kaistella palustris]